MKLTKDYFFPCVTDDGVKELYNFADSILRKCGQQIPYVQHEDVRQEMIVKCIEKLKTYDETKGVPLGGYLYWQCRGAISMWANKHQREIPVTTEALNFMRAQKNGIF